MDINIEISKIFLQYGIFNQEPGLAFLYQHEFCRILLNRMISEIPSNHTIALRGAGNDARILMSYLSAENKKRIRYVVDRNILCHHRQFILASLIWYTAGSHFIP